MTKVDWLEKDIGRTDVLKEGKDSGISGHSMDLEISGLKPSLTMLDMPS